LSPLLAAAYLLCGMVNVELGAFQRFALKWAVLVSLLMTVGALLTGAISLTH
jgi:CitMHS family citrate-Mg2+:H+ or citrate-Ca2+:H+ symporter